MPRLADVPQVVRVRFIGTDAADTSLGSHLTLKYSGAAPTSAQLATTATTWGTIWTTNIAPLVDTGFTLTTVEVIDLSSATSATIEQPVSHPGTRAGTALPLNCAMTVNAITALRRRGGHWHVQLRAGVQADTANVQQWTTAFANSVAAAWTTTLTGMQQNLWPGATGASQVGVQYYGPPNRTITSSTGRVRTVSTPLAVPAVYPITAWQGRVRIGSQRRRLG